MQHPYFRAHNGDYDSYKDMLNEWEDLPNTPEKIRAQRRYEVHVKTQLEREKNMARTATITKRENAPDFVFGSFGFIYDNLKDYVNDKGYINFDILKSKEGGYYVKISDFGLKKEETNTPVLEFKDSEEIPF